MIEQVVERWELFLTGDLPGGLDELQAVNAVHEAMRAMRASMPTPPSPP